jgi:hypothetical protein
MISKYGFDYFSQRVDVLTEAPGRPSPLLQLGPHGQVASDIFSSIGAVMRKGGEVNGTFVPGMGGNREKNRQLRYFIYMMAGLDSEETENEISDNEANYEIVSAATQILGIDKQGWYKIYKGPDKLYRKAIMQGVDGPFKEYVMSPEFKQKALDPNNILSYIATNRVTNAYSLKKAGEREEMHGMSAEDIDAAETGIKDIITKIHRAIHARNRKKKPELAQEESPDGKNNDFIDNVYSIVNAIDNIIYYYEKVQSDFKAKMKLFGDPKEALTSVIDDWDNQDPNLIVTLYKAKNLSQPLTEMMNAYSELKSTGIDLKTLYNQLEEYKSHVDPEIVDAIVEEMDRLISSSEDMDAVSATQSQKSKEEFAGYPQDIIDHFLTTPELKQQFKKYHTWSINDMISRANRLTLKLHAIKWGEGEVPGEREIVRAASKQFFEKRPEVKKQNFQEPNQAQTYLGKAKIKESYVMDYMVEQVQKDKFIPKGEFKDRGFKKPRNYWEGLNR